MIVAKYNKTETMVTVYDSEYKCKRNKKGHIARFRLGSQVFKIFSNHKGSAVHKRQIYIDTVSEFLGCKIEIVKKPTKKYSKATYREYLRSSEWQEIRAIKLEEADYKCQLCYKKERLHVHHRTYIRIFKEKLSDLTVLCKNCHEKFHDIINVPVSV